MNFDIANAEITDRLPSYFRPDKGAEFPRSLIGATIIRIGGVREPCQFMSGGLVIDYRPAKSTAIRRLLLSSTDMCMVVESDSEMQSVE